jgi:hypothetical protein
MILRFVMHLRKPVTPFKIILKDSDGGDYWVFGLFPSSGIPKNTKGHNVPETGSVSVFRWKRQTPTWLRPLERSNQWLRLGISNRPKKLGASILSPEDGNRPSFRNVLFFRIPDDGQRKKR